LKEKIRRRGSRWPRRGCGGDGSEHERLVLLSLSTLMRMKRKGGGPNRYGETGLGQAAGEKKGGRPRWVAGGEGERVG
jgi:hypothetical protein